MLEEAAPQPSRTLPQFISSEQFVRMLRILRSSAPELITIELIAAFEVQSSTAFTVAFIGGSAYVIGSAAHFVTLNEENKNAVVRKVFTAIDNFLHANWMALRLVSSIAVTGIVLAEKKIGPIIVPDWVIVPLEIPAVAVALGYAITQALEMKNKSATVLSSILVAAQLSRLLNITPDILVAANVNFDWAFLYRAISILVSTGVATALKLCENGRPNIVLTQSVIQYLSWLTYPISVVLDNVQLRSIVWPATTYTAEAITAAATVFGVGVLASKYYNSTSSPEEEVPLIPSVKKTETGCWSRVKEKLSNCCCWASWWGTAASMNNSNSMSAQTGLSAETASSSGSLSLNSGAQTD
ncbi:MAG: hypothetical protein SFW07_06350 [Gammaproteobacteria bacterium]|nr:hypothetical protein [Gammaproteobacteria bacterium]